MKEGLIVRPAELPDAPSLRNIYAEYINTPVSFEYNLPSESEFAGRMAGIIGEYPYLICQICGETAGYAYAHRHMEREAYQWNAELSIYLGRNYVSRGIGALLYSILMDILSAQGVKNVYGCVTLPNFKSERLHQSLGFSRAGVFLKTGYKCGEWHDVCWFEKRLAPIEGPPGPVIPVSGLPEGLLSALIERRLNLYKKSG